MKTGSFVIQKMPKGDRLPEPKGIPSLVLSDTSGTPHRAQTPISARPFVGVSVSIITSFFGFSMGIDSSRSVPRLERGRAQFDWGAPQDAPYGSNGTGTNEPNSFSAVLISMGSRRIDRWRNCA